METTFDIILVSWNRKDYLKRTVASLIQSGAYSACERFIVIDNHSMDTGISEFLDVLRGYQKTFVITRPDNDGWATAVNDAIGVSRAKYVLVCNNDVEFEPQFMDRMFEAIDHHPKIGILGVWRHTSHGFKVNGVYDRWFREMDDVPAVAWLMPKSAMQVVGMLPEKGVCLTKGGNGEDSGYVNMMKDAGFMVGVPAFDIGTHIDGY